ncbi:MAG: LysE family translocator [Xanthomonadales bacterium]|jgi:threonine/homoserine/homoserine lactone efflux protein|nr:LysE family translocator [Xanthomonadales bacterium]
MQQYQFMIPIAVALLLGAMSPGPSFLLVAQTSVEQSRWHGFAVTLGMGCGATVFALLSFLGLYVVLETIPTLYWVLKLLGGGYLCYLAYRFWQSAGQQVSNTETELSRGGLYKAYWRGLLTQLSNPKTAIVLAGIFAAFMPRELPAYSYSLMAVITFLVDILWYSVVVLALSTRQARAVYFRFKKVLGRLAGALMAGIGVKLALLN